jgi:hypothetical protein
MAECLSRLKQPYLTDPYTKDTTNIIKLVENYDTDTTGSQNWVTVVNSSGNNFEVQQRTWKTENNEHYEIDISELELSFKCSLKENATGGTDIEGADLETLNNKMFVAFAPVFIMMFVMAMMGMLLHIRLHGFSLNVAYALYSATMLYTVFYGKKLLPQMSTVKFINKLLDAKAPLLWRGLLRY